MNPIHYCQQKVAPPGSSWYYSTRFLPHPKRHWVWATQALRAEFLDLLHLRTEATVIQQKAQWWIEEWVSTTQGHPSHPVTQAIHTLSKSIHCDLEPIHSFCLQLGRALGPQRFQTEADFGQFVDDLELPFYTLSAQGVLSQEAFQGTQASISHITRVIAMIARVTALRQDTLAGRVYIPETLFEAHGASLDPLQRLEMTPEWAEVLKQWAASIRQNYDEALQGVPREHLVELHWLIIRCQLGLRLLEEVEKSQFPVLEQEIHLTPLVKFCLARRTWKGVKKGFVHHGSHNHSVTQ